MPQTGRRSPPILVTLMLAHRQYHQVNVCHYPLMLHRRWGLQERSRAWRSFRAWFVRIPLFVQKKYPQRIHASWLSLLHSPPLLPPQLLHHSKSSNELLLEQDTGSPLMIERRERQRNKCSRRVQSSQHLSVIFLYAHLPLKICRLSVHWRDGVDRLDRWGR